MRGRNNTKNMYIVTGSKLAVLTQTLFWIVLLKMPALYLVTVNKANKIWGITGNENEKKTENVVIQLSGSVRALRYRQGVFCATQLSLS